MPTPKGAPASVRRIKIEAEGDFEQYDAAILEAAHRAENYGGKLKLVRVTTKRTRVIKSWPSPGGMSHSQAGTRLQRIFIFR